MAEFTRNMLVLAGIHGAGKSTARKMISNMGFLTHDEIGWALRQKTLLKNCDLCILKGQDLAWFDRLVFQIELLRDNFIEATRSLPHCVETWHLGNLAYAALRSPDIFDELEALLALQVCKMNPFIIHIVIDHSTFIKRCSLHDMTSSDLYSYYININTFITHYISQNKLDSFQLENNGSLNDFHDGIQHALHASGILS